MNISANFKPKSDYILTIYTNLSTVNTYVAHNAEKSWLYDTLYYSHTTCIYIMLFIMLYS